MIRLIALGLLALSTGALAQSATRPTRAALQRVAASCGPSLVVVETAASRVPGVVVGNRGEVLTFAAAPSAGGDAPPPTRVRVGEALLEAEALHEDHRAGLRLVRAATAEGHLLQPVPFEPADLLTAGHWVIALVRKEGTWVSLPLQLVAAKGAGDTQVLVRAALPPGTPLFDARGRLVASVVNRGKGRTAGVRPLGALRRAVAGSTPP